LFAFASLIHLRSNNQIIEISPRENTLLVKQVTVSHYLRYPINQIPPHPNNSRPRNSMIAILHICRLIRQTSRPKQLQRHGRFSPARHTPQTILIHNDGQFPRILQHSVRYVEFFAELFLVQEGGFVVGAGESLVDIFRVD
jgi:hypothetical protein